VEVVPFIRGRPYEPLPLQLTFLAKKMFKNFVDGTAKIKRAISLKMVKV
jgi:hypothetical protein